MTPPVGVEFNFWIHDFLDSSLLVSWKTLEGFLERVVKYRKSKNAALLLTIRLPKGMAFIPFLSLFIAKDKEHLRPRSQFSLSFAMKRDKSHPFWKPAHHTVKSYFGTGNVRKIVCADLDSSQTPLACIFKKRTYIYNIELNGGHASSWLKSFKIPEKLKFFFRSRENFWRNRIQN